MKRKGGWLAGSLLVAILLFFLCSWIVDRDGEIGEVQWSPMFTRRVVDALVPVTSQVAYAGPDTLTGFVTRLAPRIAAPRRCIVQKTYAL